MLPPPLFALFENIAGKKSQNVTEESTITQVRLRKPALAQALISKFARDERVVPPTRSGASHLQDVQEALVGP